MLSRIPLIVGLCTIPLAALGHHSFGGTYDTEARVEIEGEVTRVMWRNPHVAYLVNVRDADGVEREWHVEANSLSLLRRAGLTSDLVNVGDRVRASGWPARRSDTSMFVLNMLIPGGEEILWFRTPAQWSDQTIGDWDVWFSDGSVKGADEVPTLFTVWTSNFAGEDRVLWETDYPLTETARAAQAAFDVETDSPLVGCAPKGMPYIMEQPYPLQFIDQGDIIVLHTEEYDTMRLIYMTASAAPAEPVTPRLGLSVGRWEDGVLVVETTKIDWTHFDPTGIPISPAIETVERFSLSRDGRRLDYEITVTDPATFTEPVVLDSYWTRRDGAQVQPYRCTVDAA